MYAAVPMMSPMAVAGPEVRVGESVGSESPDEPSWSSALARPKSSTFTLPSRAILTFAGLRSRWTIPRSCAASKRFCNLQRDRDRFVQGNRTAREPVLERLAVNQLEDEHGHPLAGRVALFDAVDCRDVRMVQRGEQTGLALEARQPLRIGQEQGRKNFAGDVSLQPKIAGAVDLTHPARPERSSDLVATDPGPRG